MCIDVIIVVACGKQVKNGSCHVQICSTWLVMHQLLSAKDYPHLTRLTWLVPVKVPSASELFAFLLRLAKISPTLRELYANFYFMALVTDADYRGLEQTCIELDRSGNLELLSLLLGAKLPPETLALLKRRVRWMSISCT